MTDAADTDEPDDMPPDPIRGGWVIDDRIDSAAALHSADIPSGLGRAVWFMVPTAPALVLGSSQKEAEVDRTALDDAGLALAKRRSGGGAVLVDSSSLWVDFLIGPGDPLWDDDVGRAFGWVGELWVRALRSVAAQLSGGDGFDPAGLAVHAGPLERNLWNRQVCFASVGPGEVTLDGRKVVGVSQRRTKAGCRFQCSVILEDRQRLVPALLSMAADDRTAAREQVIASTVGLGVSAVTVRRVLTEELSAART